ncbi:MAG TPA: peptidoglycan-binding domain-containing protein [Chthoniobacteraceae bacterium]|jgi:peptidoglycan hydrolase-like protein with peptidoglycan-binding domain|nr:peptidoglycan-binding domain-containing protein [Chthoniobacteraceae bacterium]
MTRPLLLLLLLALTAPPLLRADEPTRALQNELKAQGFYYGEVDGISGPALAAALKRYQIRNGLEVTGTPTPETLGALNVGVGTAPKPEAEPSPAAPVGSGDAPPEPVTPPKPRVDLRKKQALVESDERALKEVQEESTIRRTPRDPSVVPPPADLYRTPPAQINPRYRDVYAGSPYETAPPPLQEQTLRAAQRTLRAQGFYGGVIDGLPGPGTQDAIISYQRNVGLPRTGRLDLETLNMLRLLPGANSANPVLKPFTAPPRNSHAIRGIWVN